MKSKFLLAGLLVLAACQPASSVQAEPATTKTGGSRAAVSPAPTAPLATGRSKNVTTGYPWFDSGSSEVPQAVDSLEDRFPTERDFSRVQVTAGSFGAFLRTLPLAAPKTPVLSFRGDVIRSADHPNVAAVVAIDIGKRDLQQCADAVIRLHAEHRYARGKRDHEYRAASGTKLSFARYLAGDRLRVDGDRLSFVSAAKPAAATHEILRTWLDDVFGWANTGALARDGQKVKMADLRPGDFFVLTGVPYGHAVLVLDMATDSRGRRALLLGQSFVPAQNFHVLRSSPSSAWFVVDESQGSVTTPFWDPFPFESLRRLAE